VDVWRKARPAKRSCWTCSPPPPTGSARCGMRTRSASPT
jgi:hypothetical protein